MRLAALQMVARPGDVTKNLGLIASAAAEASALGAELLVTPELALTGYGAGAAIRDLAEPADGAQMARLQKIAADYGVTLVVGFAERAGRAIYNSAVLVEPSGRRAVYRKCHLYGRYERELFSPGDAPPAPIEIGGSKVGLLICYDVEFPEAVRRLALAGAEIVLVPTALPDTPSARFVAEKIVPVRAFENGIAIVYANHAGADRNFSYAGRSVIVMPDGSDAARADPEGAGIIVADYEPARYEPCRAENPYLRDRRADLF